MFVGSVWMIVISRSFRSLFCLADFSMYPLNIFVMFLRIQIFPVFQLIKGLYSLNHGNPKIMSEDPILLICTRFKHFRLLICV